MLHLKQASDLALPTCSVGAKIKASHNHLLILCNQNASLPVLLQPYCICSNLNNCFAGAEFPQRYISGQLKGRVNQIFDETHSGTLLAYVIVLHSLSNKSTLLAPCDDIVNQGSSLGIGWNVITWTQREIVAGQWMKPLQTSCNNFFSRHFYVLTLHRNVFNDTFHRFIE